MLEDDDVFTVIDVQWDILVNQDDLYAYLAKKASDTTSLPLTNARMWISDHLDPPIGQQEAWAAGVTYLRSQNTRMEESLTSGNATLYDRVYLAHRPEFFFNLYLIVYKGMDSRFISGVILYGMFRSPSVLCL